MDQNFISLLDAAEGLAGGNESEVEMYLALLTAAAEDGRLPCVTSWTVGRDKFPGGFSHMRQPREWRVLRTSLKSWMELQAIGQAWGYREPSKHNLTPDPAPATPAPVAAEVASRERAKAEPVVTESASNGVKATVPDWRMQIQAEAYARWLRLRAVGCNPSVFSICEDMARWCIEQNIIGGKGQNPKAGTIRNTVLGAGHWIPPYHSVEQAKMEIERIAQIAQTAQTQVAQINS